MLFNKKQFDATQECMFLGEPVNIARYDKQKFPVFEKLIEKQLSFFWRPDEIDISQDRKDFNEKLTDHERHIFTSNLKYQTLLDSVQGRAPNLCLLPIVSIPELETWIETWGFSETIHSRSYTHILRNLLPNPDEFFDDIVINEEIVKRAESVCLYGDNLIEKCKILDMNKQSKSALEDVKKALYLYIASVNILEGVRFYVSFACSFAFAERSLMEGNAKIIRLISRDEALHLNGTQQMMNIWSNGKDDPEMVRIARDCKPIIEQMYVDALEQEKEWADYLFQDGSMIGLNAKILSDYATFITAQRMQAVGLTPIEAPSKNPLPWMNAWIDSSSAQVAPQESEISSYLVGQVDSSVSVDDFEDFEF